MSYLYQIKSAEDYQEKYQQSIENPEAFWGEVAESFYWRKKWDKVLEWNFTEPNVKWFINGKLNITENCLDRHLKTEGDQPAIIWEPNDPSKPNRILTYNDLHTQVCMFGQLLKNQGVKKKRRSCLHLHGHDT